MLRSLIVVTALAAIGWTGCAAPVLQDTADLDAIKESFPVRPSAERSSENSDGNTGKPVGDRTAAAASTDQAAAELIELLAELRRTGAIDQEVQQNIIKDWHAADPSVRPQLLELFRTTLSYRRDHGADNRSDAQPAERADAKSSPAEARVKLERDRSLSAPNPSSTQERLDVAEYPAAGNTAGSKIRQPSGAAGATTESKAAKSPRSKGEQVIFRTESGSPSATLVEVNAGSEVSTAPLAVAEAVATSPVVNQPAPLPSTAGGPVGQTGESGATQAPENGSWQEHLSSAITGLESELSDSPNNASDAARHAGLRLLYLLDGRRNDALRPIDGLPPSQQDFWSSQLYGLAAYMDTERNQDAARRSAEAGHHFREALARLNSLATLEVKNLAFCTDVKSFGVYEPFAKNVFRPGQEVLVYAEVENFSTEPVPKGHKISLRTSYQILDPHGARVAKQEFPTVASECRAVRRDLFVSYSIFLPQRIYPGRYTLQLSVEDLQSQKLGSAPLEFEIEEKLP